LAAGLSLWVADYRRGRPTARPVVALPAGRQPVEQPFAATPPFATRPIEQIRVGDRVVAQDPLTGRTRLKRVLRVFRRRSDHVCRLGVRAESGLGLQWIETTDEHPFWVPGRGWVPARRLVLGDSLRQADGRSATLVDRQFRKERQGVPVYNIETEDFHTYCVAADEQAAPVLVHNCNPLDLPKLYHYTNAPVEDILRKGLVPGKSELVFLTPNGHLSPMGAQLGLSLPPNRGAPLHLLEIDVRVLQDLGLELSQLRPVARRFNMPGGELETMIPETIPPAAIRPVR
jgi:hypothetical protein